MKIGNLVKSTESWGPDCDGDLYRDEVYYPIGIVYRQHEHRYRRWWVEWVSPEHLIGTKDCMLDDWLEILNEAA
jgi:hypothetical protein